MLSTDLIAARILTGGAASGGFEPASEDDFEVPEDVENILETLFNGLQDRVGLSPIIR